MMMFVKNKTFVYAAIAAPAILFIAALIILDLPKNFPAHSDRYGNNPSDCGNFYVIDADGNGYDTVPIGNQCWMAQNINVGAKIAGNSSQTNNGIIEKYCYGDSDANCEAEGGLYQWDEVMQYSTAAGARGICPTGWHIPTNDEWTTLERSICTSTACLTDFPYDAFTIGWRGTDEGTKLKKGIFTALLTGYRNPIGTKLKKGIFTALFLGYQDPDFLFLSRKSNTNFWSSTGDGGKAWKRDLTSDDSRVYRIATDKALGFSVRCLKN